MIKWMTKGKGDVKDYLWLGHFLINLINKSTKNYCDIDK